MKNLLYTCLLTCFSLQTASAQFGVFNLDTLVKYHPHRKVIDYQVKTKTDRLERKLKEMTDAFYKELREDEIGFVDYTAEGAKRRSEELQELQSRIRFYHDSNIKTITALQNTKLDSLRSAILLDCQRYVRYHNLSFVLFSNDVLYSSNLVIDHTKELLEFIEVKYRYTLANRRIQRKVATK